MSTETWHHDNNITIHLGDPIQEINKAGKTIHSLKGLSLSYDYLILATGSSAFVPNIPGVQKDGVFVYRRIEDLDLTKAYSLNAKRGGVIGGGL